MAELIRKEDHFTLKFSMMEKVEGVHGDITFPVAAISGVRIVDNVITAVHGLRAPGTSIPGVVAMGTFWSRSEKLFVMIHHQDRRGVRIELTGQTYDAILFSTDNPEQLLSGLALKPDPAS